MGLTIHISQPAGRDWFTSAEAVQGLVSCDGLSNVSKIVVYLEGQLHLSTRTQGSPKKADLGGVHHALFSRQRILYSSRDSNASEVSLDGMSFTLNFPDGTENDLEGKDCAQCEKHLPPSFHFASDAFHASVNYRVRAVAERSGILNPDNTAVRNVEFRPMLPTRSSSTDQPWRIAKAIKGEIPGLKGKTAGDKPTVLCEFTFPASKVVRPGGHIDMGINFIIPVEIQRVWKRMWISQLVIRLRTKTVAAMGGSGKSTVDYTDVVTIKGLSPLNLSGDDSRVAVSPQLWQQHIYPFVAPTLRLCKLQRSHVLEIHVRFASKASSRPQSVEEQIDVIVESGAMLNLSTSASHEMEPPPAYE